MKLKGTAKGPSSVPMADRAYFDCVKDGKNYPLFVIGVDIWLFVKFYIRFIFVNIISSIEA